jgi:murein DD-endopeptidase MepM/ murein hydrolase activator NlpD
LNGAILRYQLTPETTLRDEGYRSNAGIYRPRQLAVTPNNLYVLDYAGSRLLMLDPLRGTLRHINQFPRRETISSFWASPQTDRLILAGKDTLYFVDRPEQQLVIAGDPSPAVSLTDPAFLRHLRGLLVPIAGSPITNRDLQMPGAPRHYRLGIHEGVDFYWATGTPIRAIADGVVVRANLDFVPPTNTQIRAWRDQSWAFGTTTAEALDGFRGRQVWLEHADGTVSRYVHLSEFALDIVEGATVVRGQLLGTVGNSGSPASIISEDEDAHLHFEIWLGEQFLGQFLRPIEAREWVEAIFAR